jgi:DNA polymerase III epsilon subunit-like protein
MPTLAAIDLETDGLIRGAFKPEIIEIGIAKSNGEYGSPAETENWLILPPKYKVKDLSPEIVEITGITTEDLREKGMPIGKALLNLAFDLVGSDHLITYNGEDFDLPILRYHLGHDTFKFPWPPVQLDLMKISKDIVKAQGKQGRKYPRLTELVMFCFGDIEWNAHRAADDALMTIDCARHLAEKEFIRFVER